MSASTIGIQQQIYQLRSLAELLASEADGVRGAIVVDAELHSRSVRLCEGCED